MHTSPTDAGASLKRSAIVLCLILLGAAPAISQTTYDFEDIADGATTFSASGVTFDLTDEFAGAVFADFGTGNPGSDRYMQTPFESVVSGNVGGIKTRNGETFRLVSLDVWPSANAGGNVAAVGGTVTVVGLRSGAEVSSGTFTTTATGFPEGLGGAWQRITIDGVLASTDIDEFQIVMGASGGTAHNYIAVDDFVLNNLMSTDSDGTLTSSGVVVEPVNLPTTIDTPGEAVDIFDFTLRDVGSMDGLTMTISQIVVHVSGTSTDAERGKVRWRLNGNDVTNIEGTYEADADEVVFSDLSISIPDGGQEVYTLDAYFNDNTGLVEDHTYILSVDGDTDLTVGGAGTQMGATTPVTNGAGSQIGVTASQLGFTLQPAGSTSGSALTTQPVVTAQDAFGNTDIDFSETVTLTEASAGALSGDIDVAAISGVATFTDVVYAATADQQSFTLSANDQDGVGSNLNPVSANPVTSDVVATRLIFDTQPAPLSVRSGVATDFTTDPVVRAADAGNITDTGYSTDIMLSEVNGAGVATMTTTGDTDGSAATVTITPAAGVATFTDQELNYTVSAGLQETFNLRASSGGLTTTDSNQFTATNNTIPEFFRGTTETLGVTAGSGAMELEEFLQVQDTDSGQTLTWSVAAGPSAGGSLDGFPKSTASTGNSNNVKATGTTYTPPAGAGADSFTIQISDGTDAATIVVTVNVLGDVSDGELLVFDSGESKALFRIDSGDGDRSVLSQSSIEFPNGRGVAVLNGTIYAVDVNLDAIFEIDPTDGSRTKISGDGVGAGPAFEGLFNGIVIEPNGMILVGDITADAIYRVDPSDGTRTILVDDAVELAGVNGMAIDHASGSLYVIDQNDDSIIEVDRTTGALTTLSGAGTGSGTAFNTIDSGIAVDDSGDILVADRGNDALVRVDPVTGARSNVASFGAQPNNANPVSVTIDRNTGAIFVADSNNNSILEVNAGTGAVTLISQALNTNNLVGGATGSGMDFTSPEGIAFFPNTVVFNNAPVFTANGPFTIDENSSVTTAVGNLDANDGDGGVADANVTYSITAGNTTRDGDGDLPFAIDANIGAITVNDAGDVDFEGGASFTLTVQADDGEDADNTATVSVTVNVTDVNEAPVITSAVETDVAENTTEVMDVTAVDQDAGDALTFAITGGADAVQFSIDANSGALTFDAAPDFENRNDVGANNVYNVQVTVTDVAELTGVIDIAVTVTDVFEPLPVTLSVDNASISETGGIATITASIPAATTRDVVVDLAFSGTALFEEVFESPGPGPDDLLPGDYDESATQITIPSGGTSAAVTVAAVHDGENEADETVVVDIDAVTDGVEDGNQQVTITILDDDEADYGDAPLPYPVATGSGIQAGFGLGSTTPDAESGMQRTDDADGDDGDGSDDEDGVVFSTDVFRHGETESMDVTVFTSGFTAFVHTACWIDFDRSGSWEANERVLNEGESLINTSKTYSQDFTVPLDAEVGVSFARCIAGVGLDAGDFPDPEIAYLGALDVEDYQVGIGPANETPAFDSGVTDVLVVVEDAAAAAINDLLAVTDGDSGDVLTWSVPTEPADGMLNGFDATESSDGNSVTPSGLTYTPDADFHGSDSFVVEVSDGIETDQITINVTVSPIADTPTVTNATTDEDVQTTGGLVISRNAADGTEVTHFEITGITGGTLFKNDGTTAISSGDLITFAEGNAGLKFTPTVNSTANGSFAVQASTTANDTGVGGGTATATITVNAANDAPVFAIVNTTPTIEEEGTHTFSLGDFIAISDVDAGGGDLVMTVTATSIFSANNSGTADVQNNGTSEVTITGTVVEINGALDGATYTPSENQTAGASVTFSVNDGGNTGSGGAQTVEQVITFTVTPVNDAPVITSATAVNVEENTTAAGTVTFTDPDAGDDHVFSITGGADAALFSVDASTGALAFIAAPNFEANGSAGGTNTYEVQVTVTDDGTGSKTGVKDFVVTVIDANDAPVISSAATANAAESQTSVMTVTATDEDQDILAFAVTGGGDAALFMIDQNSGVLSFLTAPDFENPTDAGGDGIYNVAVTVTDEGNLTGTGNLAVTITDANDTPTISDIGNQPIAEDGQTGSLAFTVGDAETAVGALTLSVVSSDQALIPDASLTLGGAGSNRTVVVIPAAHAHGTATITVTVSDGVLSVQDTFDVEILSVNDEPSFAAGSGVTVDEDSGDVVRIGWATNISPGPANESAQSVTFDVTIDNGALFATPPAISATGELTFTPAGDANGVATVTVSLSDNGGVANGGDDTFADQLFTITVNAVNDAPVLTVPGAQATTEDTPVTFSALGGNAITVSDVDAAASNLSVTLTATSTVDLSQTTGLAIGGGADGSDMVQFSGTLADINAALDGLVYTPSPNQIAGASLTIEVSDGGATGSGGALSDMETITINVTSVNDIPDAAPDLVTTEEDTAITIAVLANDSDPDGDVLSVSIASPASNGQTQLNPDGTITYTPDANFFGEDRFDYTVTDPSGASDSEAVRVTVTSVNDAPVASDDAASLNQDASVIIDVLANDSDTESTVSVSAVGSPSNGTALDNGDGTVTYTPEAGYFGPDSFTYTITDGTDTAQASVSITVTSTNSAPVANADAALVYSGESVQIDLLGNDTDADGDGLSLVSIDTPAQGTAIDNGDGTMTYTADADAEGEDTFGYTISDGAASVAGTVTVSITSAGPDGDGVDNSIEDGASNDGDGNDDGVKDGEQENVASLPIAEGPNAGSFVTVGAPSGQPLSQVQSTVNPSPGDYPAGASSPVGFLAYTISNVPESGTVVTINFPPSAVVTGYMKYGPTPQDPTPHWYNFAFDGSTGAVIVPGRILLFFQDGERGDDDLTKNGTIVDPGTPVFLQENAAPVAAADAASVDEDSALQIDALANDTDADGDDLTVMLESEPTHGSVTLDGDVFTYTPEADFFGEDSFTYIVRDPDGAASAASVAITVAAVQDVPVAGDDEAETLENTPVTFSLFANDFDVDGDAFWLTSQDDAQHGTSVYNDDGTVTYTPEPGFFGTDTWVYSITDGPGASGTTVFGTITVTVTEDPNSTSRDINQELPTEVFLDQNYPNPFNPATTVEFGLPEAGMVRIEIFDVQGRLVKVLVSETLPAGRHTRQLEMGDVPSGVYLYRLVAGGRSYSRTLQLVK